MIDMMLRFDTEAEAVAVLFMLRGEDGWITDGPTHALDVIGATVVTPAVVGLDGDIVSPAVMDDRWHANLRLTDDADPAIGEAAVPYAVNPSSPQRVWA